MSGHMRVGSLIKVLANDPWEEIDKDFAHDIDAAHKFLILDPEAVLQDEITQYANLLVRSGLCIPPFEQCYFEFHNSGRLPLNVKTVGIYLLKTKEMSAVYTRGFHQLTNSEYEWDYSSFATGWLCNKEKDCSGWVDGYADVYKQSEDYKDPVERGHAQTKASDVALLAACAIALLDIKDVSQARVAVSDKVALKRNASGKTPFYSHTVLTIRKSHQKIISGKKEALLERRAHWRRGHLRHLSDERVVPVSPALIRGKGFVSKDYRL